MERHFDKDLQALKDNLARHPNDRDTLSALIGFSRDTGDFAGALRYAEELAKSDPDNAELKSLIEQLRKGTTPPQ